MFEAIAGVQAIGAGVPVDQLAVSGSAAPAGVQGTGFGDMVTHGLDQVNQQLMTSQVDLQQLAAGNVQNLHQVMIGLEESRVSFQLLIQVRNRMLESYQDIMKMQV